MVSLRLTTHTIQSADLLPPLNCQQGRKRLPSGNIPSSPFAGFSLGTALGGIVSEEVGEWGD
jgi:hypothetical protein